MTSVFELTSGEAFGYVTGAQVEQANDKTTAVTINAVAGKIQTGSSEMTAGQKVIFTVNNDKVADGDVVVVCVADGNNTSAGGLYHANVTLLEAGRFDVVITNFHSTPGTDQLDINFIVIKSSEGVPAS